MDFCTENGFEKCDDALRAATVGGYLDCVKYCIKNGYKGIENITKWALHLNIIKYCVKHGFKKHENAILNAIFEDDLKLLKYCTENGFPKPKNATSIAV